MTTTLLLPGQNWRVSADDVWLDIAESKKQPWEAGVSLRFDGREQMKSFVRACAEAVGLLVVDPVAATGLLDRAWDIDGAGCPRTGLAFDHADFAKLEALIELPATPSRPL